LNTPANNLPFFYFRI